MASGPVSPSSSQGVEGLIARLTEAIQTGNARLAKDLVAEVSNSGVKLNISRSKEQRALSSKEKEFSIMVHLEERESNGINFDLMVKSTDSIADLKKKVWMQYNIPDEAQRWIIGKKIPDDKMTLGKCGVSCDGHFLFLYIVTARADIFDGLDKTEQAMETCRYEESLSSPNIMSNTMSYKEQGKNLDQLLMNPNNKGLAMDFQTKKLIMELQGQSAPPPVPDRVPVQSDHNDLGMVIPAPSNGLPTLQEDTEPEINPTPGWVCPLCTLINLPTRPGCEMCSTDRPEGYIVPDDYQMTDREVAMIAHQEEVERLTRQKHETALRNNFNQWLMLDDVDLIMNTANFTCPICFDEFEPGEGIVLRDCLHQFCKDCLQGAVTHSEEPTLTCPYQDDEGSCESVLQEREIRALVPEDIFIKYLQRGLDQAESQAANSFHCKTTDCKGWCLYEDEVNFFICPICKKENCLTCKVIHEGMNCKEYQTDLAAKAINDEAAKKTQQMIQEMVNNGTAMNCPQCQIVVQKKDGCDWIKCSVCKTEICWVTKGRRWGPKGNGDISGGCRCGVQGKRCHTNCANCH